MIFPEKNYRKPTVDFYYHLLYLPKHTIEIMGGTRQVRTTYSRSANGQDSHTGSGKLRFEKAEVSTAEQTRFQTQS